MTYEEFLEKVNNVPLSTTNYHHHVYVGQKPQERSWYTRDKPEDTDDYLVHQVETGGVFGGSCWDDSNPQPYSTGESLGRFTGLSQIVRAVAPGINFLEYEDLLDQVETDTYHESEWYGNGTDHAYQCIKLKDLWTFLSQAHCLA